MTTRTWAEWQIILAPLAPAHAAKRILGDIIAYRAGSMLQDDDISQLANALVGFAMYARNHRLQKERDQLKTWKSRDMVIKPAYNIAISEAQRERIVCGLELLPDDPKAHEDEDIQYLLDCLRDLPEDEKKMPGVLHGLCL